MNKKTERPKFLQSTTKKDLAAQRIVRMRSVQATVSKIPFLNFYKPVSKIV